MNSHQSVSEKTKSDNSRVCGPSPSRNNHYLGSYSHYSCLNLIRLWVHVGNVRLLELVKTCQCSCSSHSSQDVGSRALEKRGNALILQNLHRAVHGARVLHRLTRGHHHSTTNRVNRIRCDSRGHSDSISQSERGECPSSFRHHGSHRVV